MRGPLLAGAGSLSFAALLTSFVGLASRSRPAVPRALSPSLLAQTLCANAAGGHARASVSSPRAPFCGGVSTPSPTPVPKKTPRRLCVSACPGRDGAAPLAPYVPLPSGSLLIPRVLLFARTNRQRLPHAVAPTCGSRDRSGTVRRSGRPCRHRATCSATAAWPQNVVFRTVGLSASMGAPVLVPSRSMRSARRGEAVERCWRP